jgi:hypothetical protein
LAGGGLPWLRGIVLRRALLWRATRQLLVSGSPVLRLYNRLVVEAVERLRPDIVFVVKGEALGDEALRRIRDVVPEKGLGYFNPDEPRFLSLTMRYADAGFHVFTPCHQCLSLHRERLGGGRVTLLPFAAPRVVRGCGIRSRVALFIGSPYPERLRVVRGLLRRGVPLVVAGPGWRRLLPRSAPGVYGPGYVAATRLAYVVLNIHVSSDVGRSPT